jgi:hypothetical protein
MGLFLDCRIGVRVLGKVAWRGQRDEDPEERRIRGPSHRSVEEEEEEDCSTENTRDI